MSEADRNARLAELDQATDLYISRAKEQIMTRVATAKGILKGRTGQERLAASTATAASAVVVDEINQFLLT